MALTPTMGDQLQTAQSDTGGSITQMINSIEGGGSFMGGGGSGAYSTLRMASVMSSNQTSAPSPRRYNDIKPA